MEQIKIKKVLSLEKEIDKVLNDSLKEEYKFEENEDGIKVLSKIIFNGDIYYKDNTNEKIEKCFDIEFYVFNERIDYTLIHLVNYLIDIDNNNLIINMSFDKEMKVIEKGKIIDELDEFQNESFKNDVLVENINFDELERVINSKDTIMISSLDKNELTDDNDIEIIIDEKENENKDEEVIDITEEKEDKKRESLFKEEYKKVYFYYRMKETDSIENLKSMYRNNFDSILIDKSNYKKDDIICFKLK